MNGCRTTTAECGGLAPADGVVAGTDPSRRLGLSLHVPLYRCVGDLFATATDVDEKQMDEVFLEADAAPHGVRPAGEVDWPRRSTCRGLTPPLGRDRHSINESLLRWTRGRGRFVHLIDFRRRSRRCATDRRTACGIDRGSAPSHPASDASANAASSTWRRKRRCGPAESRSDGLDGRRQVQPVERQIHQSEPAVGSELLWQQAALATSWMGLLDAAQPRRNAAGKHQIGRETVRSAVARWIGAAAGSR